VNINKKYLALGAIVLAIIGVLFAKNYHWVAVQLAPGKQPATARSESAKKADALFWETLHGGEYEKIPQVLVALTAAYLENPSDAVTAAHVGFMHMWRLTERARMKSPPPTITDHAVLARKYFQEAVTLDPSDPRYLGFLGSATLAEGGIHRNEKIIRSGYYTLLDAIEAWPAFNLFTAGYSMSRQPVDSPQYRKALEWQWRSLDVCAKEKVDRQNPDFSRYGALVRTETEKRVCANSWIAPHNHEGFFLNMGDMLVKAGNWQTARNIYAVAKISPDYANWKFRGVLEDRITEAQVNVARFNEPDRPGETRKLPIMVNSEFSCMGCHQK
jgi:hypothetical protein